MKFWQSLAFVEMDQMTELARFCEELGFHGVSYGDHLVTTAEQVDDYEYGDNGNILWNPDTHWPDDDPCLSFKVRLNNVWLCRIGRRIS